MFDRKEVYVRRNKDIKVDKGFCELFVILV